MSPPLILRSSISNYVVFGAILGPIVLLDAYLTIKNFNMWPALLCSGALLAVVFGWIASVRLSLTNGQLLYRDWLRSQNIALTDVMDAQTATGLAFSKTGRLLPFRRLVLKTRNDANHSTVYVNLATLNPRGVRELMVRLNARDVVRG